MALIMGGSSLMNMLPSFFPSGRQKQSDRLQRQQLNLVSSFLTPGAFDAGGFGSNYFFGAPSDLQRMTRNQLMTGPSPEQQTFDFASPILQGMLTGTGPQFEHDIASANQQGGRFGSANAMLRGEALRNLFNMRTQTAGTLGALGSAAGGAQLARANYADQDSTRRAQLLAGLLGFGGQLGAGQQQPSSPFHALGQGGLDFATLMTLFGKNGGGAAGWTPGVVTGAGYGGGTYPNGMFGGLG